VVWRVTGVMSRSVGRLEVDAQMSHVIAAVIVIGTTAPAPLA
jgi:hypothetical protein